ncbi:Scr1 family TA system antitoxin-like transcriptional regulator [Streptomyces sp. NRRL S-15]|uniref:Scr1 family TA system antitoxin-like transcriptional regulator n=1 Tax=Streptomyces sp. NRRL S-15 TaxID=1463886 RepID=UPI00068A4BBC|nr:Scr1 family TA system antitoxin-like transcriptional regulator [Streptomyces sp. NRRL S-15]
MKHQIESLIEATELHSVVLQVLELDQGDHPLLGGFTTVLSFASRPDVAYIESSYSGELVEQAGAVAEFSLAFDHLQAIALSPRASLDLIRATSEEKYCDPGLPIRSRRRRLAQVQLQQRAGRRLRGSR